MPLSVPLNVPSQASPTLKLPCCLSTYCWLYSYSIQYACDNQIFAGAISWSALGKVSVSGRVCSLGRTRVVTVSALSGDLKHPLDGSRGAPGGHQRVGPSGSCRGKHRPPEGTGWDSRVCVARESS